MNCQVTSPRNTFNHISGGRGTYTYVLDCGFEFVHPVSIAIESAKFLALGFPSNGGMSIRLVLYWYM